MPSNDFRAEIERERTFRHAAGEFRASMEMRAMALSPDGEWLAVAAPNEPARLVRAAAGFGQPAPIALGDDTSHTVNVLFSSDGKRLVTNQVNVASTVSLWELATGRKAVTLPVQPKAVSSLALSRDGDRLATASLDQTLKIWDARGGELLRSLAPVTTVFTALAFSPDGKRLAAAGHDQAVKIWDLDDGKVIRSFPTGRYFSSGVSFSNDGRWFAAPALDGFKVWDTGTWRETYVPLSRTISSHEYALVSFSRDGKRLTIQVGADVRVWDSEAWREVVTRSKPPFPVFFRCLALSQDGRWERERAALVPFARCRPSWRGPSLNSMPS